MLETPKKQLCKLKNMNSTHLTAEKAIIRALPLGIIAFDSTLKIFEANCRAEALIKPGEYIDASLTEGTEADIWGNWKVRLSEVINSGKTLTLNKIRYNFQDRQRLLNIICTPLKDGADDIITGAVMVVEDITEKANIENQLANTERLAAVGKLAGKVAHELNNPMDGILRYINLAMRIIEQQKLQKPMDYLQQCRKGLMRMMHIISELLEFSRSSYSAFEDIPMDQIIDDAIKAMSHRTVGTNVEIVRNYPSPLPRVRSGNLFQVFCNLIKNAIDAMDDGGKVTITCNISADNVIKVEVHDTGPGFAPENSESIFEPFFTTKRFGKGTGLGLAICKDIIEKYGGQITAQNATDGGSIFTVCLPLKK